MDRKDSEIRKDGEATARAVSESPSELTSSSTATRKNPTSGLLRQGEDFYSLGMYQQAIHVWTRILFLERGNTEARKAIERGKKAIAERQRLLDAELAAADDLLDDGDIEEAAEKIRQVLSVDPRNREGQQLAERVAHLSRRREAHSKVATRGAGTSEEISTPKRGLLLRVSRSRASERSSPSSSPLKMAGFVLGAVLLFGSGALYLSLNWDSIVSDGAFQASPLAPGSSEPLSVSIPGASELRYYNGARLFDEGHYREALDELRLVERDSAVADEARSLVLRIEERLLRGASEPERN